MQASLSRASCLLPASRAPRARAILGLGASQREGRRQPFPQLHLPPSGVCAHPTLGTSIILAAWPICSSPAFLPALRFAHACCLLCRLWASPKSPSLHTHLQTGVSLGFHFAYTPLLCTCRYLQHFTLGSLFLATLRATLTHLFAHSGCGPFAHFCSLYPCTLLHTPCFLATVSLHSPSHTSTLICTLKYPFLTQEMTSSSTHLHTSYLHWDLKYNFDSFKA